MTHCTDSSLVSVLNSEFKHFCWKIESETLVSKIHSTYVYILQYIHFILYLFDITRAQFWFFRLNLHIFVQQNIIYLCIEFRWKCQQIIRLCITLLIFFWWCVPVYFVCRTFQTNNQINSTKKALAYNNDKHSMLMKIYHEITAPTHSNK